MITPVIGFIFSIFLTPYIGSLMKKAGIVGKDIHKPDKPEVPEMGGIVFLLVLPLSLTVLLNETLAKALLVFLLFGVVGIIDDTTQLKQSHKVLLSLLVSSTIISMSLDTDLNILLASFELGLLYYLFAVLFVTGSANLVNLLAGFNGLEVGTSAIVLFFLGLITSGDAQILAFTGSAIALGFLWWNRYPAKIFPGDTGTLSLGALIGLIGILGKVEIFAAFLLLPHFVDFLLKSKIRFKGRPLGRTEVLEDGTLKAPPYLSFLGLLMRIKRVKEPQLVAMVWEIEVILGFIVLLLHHLL
ncbi:MAG: UDP-N-acetylglucosamine--dolichyl-phosphate N-acetylglucosaminephosphotransferase [Thermococcaceae archaeon]|jgi:UDP-N-acetylglucosamine--dolichyl-phosphate N-acetylglucosaminephosphotransferase|nr:UDP-N-acetylglucosamine--dolichyl-phosphate N-acetylglucosaminephosphotransferase [Thermococcaceae archaeon]MDK2983612.1 UDP-N-acetylglucosamine--dolichyl-phosphate N-acetylglucosaminephosphotransferase [Thermococcaceae archaeon]MDN5320040.1 UDP-N-acetylglucosamine--dolichyl-phosphate N-acetylglucosaminephosphotransferase [Thermococcaceae archaeon]